MSRNRALSDPLTLAAMPPVNESSQDRDRRLRDEAEAKKVSDAIDAQLKEERLASKRKKEVKVLLLGHQPASAVDSPSLEFQLMYAPNAFRDERFAWRGVIYLNLVRSIRRIVDALSADYENEIDADGEPIRPGTATSVHSAEKQEQFDTIRARLQPLLSLEGKLIRMLNGEDLTDDTRSIASKEIYVHSNAPWKKVAAKLRGAATNTMSTPEVPSGHVDDDPAHTLAASKLDMITLWRDPAVRDVLNRRKMRLEESSGFFLDEIDRIATTNYVPSEDDVLKARLKTLGVVEHTFTVDTSQVGLNRGVDWKIYDVGGARSQRHAWIPYFDDVNAIIFLAPISAFDQTLAEDPTVNRVEDSLLLWRAICSNKLLANTSVVLFLNKTDLLRTKIDAGVKLANYMTSYGERPNDYASVSKYFRNKFLALHKSYSPNQAREIYVHLTSVIDREGTSAIILNVRDILLRANLKNSQLV
ncbi:G-alpha-domain-containing protein [Exidia glandulosa HHB12029]|uniref:G-alpha-domain-containing protein n=1 Tax=Exidia glandulosa HHB12029 TaxID=1314781 RepID=A0A165MHB7_EXIGL|nr:G-alpha-domain-containing protein [Exidia glandulosa HHB12029]